MKLCKLRAALILATVLSPMVVLCTHRTVEAQTEVYWTTGTGNWHDAYSPPDVAVGWQAFAGGPGVIPNFVGASAVRSGGAVSTVNVNAPATVGNITRSGTASNPFTVNPTFPLTMNQDNTGSGVATITMSATGTGGRLIFGAGNITLADNTLIQYTGRTTGAASDQNNGAIQILSTIDGVGELTLSSTHAVGTPTDTVFRGAIRLQNGSTPNTFQGSVFIPKGLVAFNGQSFGNTANVITLGAASSDSAAMVATADTASVPNKVVVAANNTGFLTLGSTSNSTFTPFSGEIVLDSSIELRVGTGTASSTQTFSGVMAGAGGLTKTGSSGAIAVLAAANTYTGKTTITTGSIQVTSINKVVGGSASSSLGAPTSIAHGTIGLGSTTTSGTLSYVGAGETTDRVIDLAGTTGGGAIDSSGTGALVFTSDITATGSGAKTLILTGSNTDGNALNGAVINGLDVTSVTKIGVGSWTLGGTNSYTGSTTVENGTLNITGSHVTGSSYLVSSGAVLNSKNIRVTGALALDGTATINANGAAAGASKVETLTIGAGGKLNLKDNDLVVGTGPNFNAVRTAIIAGKTNNAASGITSDITGFGISRGFAYAMGNDPKVSSLLAGSLSGQAFDTDSVLVKFTLRGDADLDGDTDLNDLGLWSSGYTGDLGVTTSPTTFWTSGDFDYDGDTDLNDLGLWSSTYTGDFNGGPGSLVVNAPNATPEAVAILNSMGFTVVPEPGTISLLIVAVVVISLKSVQRSRRTLKIGSRS